ncbi:protein SPT2 homolog [Anguilla rostrata]|uniref:protein SPT2 homolog n=1 Tax=Anguilla rostrata TaxID=7938 RepID=UPI0030D3D9F9
MDFENVLSIASQNQGLNSVSLKKRYSLQAGPPKKDPRSKGVNSAAIQAFLKKREVEDKKKEQKMKKQKDELLAKRVELKSDRKARAMASRTKDNFKGYNGIPVVELPKKRGMKAEASEDHRDTDYEDNYEYSQSDSDPDPDPDPEPEPERVPSRPLSKPSQKPPAATKPAPPPMNFAELLKLAQKKQFEPVELKPVKKSEERLRTAEELKELEMERRARRLDRGGDARQDRGGDTRQERGGDAKRDRGVDAKRDRGVGDARQDRGGEGRQDRGGDCRQDRGGEGRQDRGGEGRRDRGGDAKGIQGVDARRDRGGDARWEQGGDIRQEWGGDARQDRGGDAKGIRGGDARRDRGGDSRQEWGGDIRRERGGDARREQGGDARWERGGDARQDRRPQATPSSSKRSAPMLTANKMAQNGKPHKSSSEKPPLTGTSKKPKPHAPGEREREKVRERPNGSSKPSCPARPKPVSGSSSPSGAFCSKAPMKASTLATAKMPAPRPALSQRPPSSTSSDLIHRKGNPPSLPPGKSAGSGTRPSSTPHGSTPARPPGMAKLSSGTSGRPGGSVPPQPRKGEPARLGKGPPPPARPSSNGQTRPAPSGPPRPSGHLQPRPGGSSQSGVRPMPQGPGRPGDSSSNGQTRPAPSGPPRPSGHLQPRPGGSSQSGVRPMPQGPGRPGDSSAQGRPISSLGSGPGRPKCTVVSETISSKNFVPKPGMGPRIPPGYRPMMRPPGPPLPPITSSYKRKYEDMEDEYDSEMEDFIDDEGEDQSVISKHIREIFGYDRTKFKDESDYALRFMESSWRDQQKEEARSLKLAVLEDLEEEKREEEELKQQSAKKRKNR